MRGFHWFSKENSGMTIKIGGGIGGIKGKAAILTALLLYFGVPLQVIGEAGCHNTALAYDRYPFGHKLRDTW